MRFPAERWTGVQFQERRNSFPRGLHVTGNLILNLSVIRPWTRFPSIDSVEFLNTIYIVWARPINLFRKPPEPPENRWGKMSLCCKKFWIERRTVIYLHLSATVRVFMNSKKQKNSLASRFLWHDATSNLGGMVQLPYANILNKQSCATDGEWSFMLRIGHEVNFQRSFNA